MWDTEWCTHENQQVKILFLHLFIYVFWKAEKNYDSELNSIKHALNSVCSYFLKRNFN
jgi:hypothetical protein